MKRILSLLIVIALLNNSIHIFAQELPNEFWGINDKYTQAIEQKDDYSIIEFGQKSIKIIENEPQSDQIIDIMASRLGEVGLAYERLGEYENALKCYERYIPYAEKKGWADGVKIAKAKTLQYTTNIDLYLAKDKKTEEVLFGTNFDGETRKNLTNETMILVYIEFGDTNFFWVDKTLMEAQKENKTVEIALNMPGEGTQIKSVLDSEDYILNLLKVIQKYNDVPVLLRYAAEMNIWTDVATPKEFISAFRFVSSIAKKQAPNVNMVWSVNQVSSWNIDMNDYYPGDEYVDYVGVSSYAQRYFLGKNDWNDSDKFNEIVFLTGDSADPVKALTEVITKYGDRKPIIIAEGGVSHYIRSLNEDTTDWAIYNLKKMYNYVPMVYPQVKMIAYFDKAMDNETNDYALSNNSRVADAYKELVKLPHFQGTVKYEKLEDNIEVEQKPQDIYSYIHIFGHSAIKVSYYLDDKWICDSNDIPYNKSIDFSKYSLGTHNLKAVAEENGAVLKEKTFNINIVEKSISVMLNDNLLLFDTNPITINDRTLVPMRVIFEAMGASVDWNENDQSIISKLNDTTIQMQIGKNVMTKDKKEISLEAAPTIIGDRTLVPIRAISEAFGGKVSWDEETRTVKIYTN